MDIACASCMINVCNKYKHMTDNVIAHNRNCNRCKDNDEQYILFRTTFMFKYLLLCDGTHHYSATELKPQVYYNNSYYCRKHRDYIYPDWKYDINKTTADEVIYMFEECNICMYLNYLLFCTFKLFREKKYEINCEITHICNHYNFTLWCRALYADTIILSGYNIDIDILLAIFKLYMPQHYLA